MICEIGTKLRIWSLFAKQKVRLFFYMSDDSLQTNLGPDADTAIEHADSEVLPIVSPATACYPAGYFCFTD